MYAVLFIILIPSLILGLLIFWKYGWRLLRNKYELIQRRRRNVAVICRSCSSPVAQPVMIAGDAQLKPFPLAQVRPLLILYLKVF